MIMELTTAPQTLIPVATGKAANGAEYTVTVAPDYVAFQERMQGALLYLRRQPIAACENDDQREGWRIEREWEKGQGAYLRALQEADLPASWADTYVSKPLPFEPPF